MWQQCGGGGNSFLPETVNPDVSLDDIMGWLGRRAGHNTGDRPRPDPEELYPIRLRAMMPQPTEQVGSCLAVKLTRAEKQALDLLAAWPLCDTGQLAGLMGGVTRRRANQVIRALTDLALIRADGESHVLTDEGLTYLARRDRAAVGQILDRWTAEPSLSNPHVYAGTALRAMASQPEHNAALTPWPPVSPPNAPAAGTTESWTCCPPPAPPWGTGTATPTTWSTPTCPSPWTCPRDTATALWNTSAGPPRPSG